MFMFEDIKLDVPDKGYSNDPDKIYWLIDTSYAKNQAHTLHFIAEDGQEKRISIRDVYPFFYVRNQTKQQVEDRIEFLEKKHLVQNVDTVIRKNPITREEERVVRVFTWSPRFVSNKRYPDYAVSSIFDQNWTHNNHVQYHNVVLNSAHYIMGMPYRFKNRLPVLVLDGLDENRELYEEVFTTIPQEAQDVGKGVFRQIHAILPRMDRMLAACDIEAQANFAESVDAIRAEIPITSISVTTWKNTRVFTLDNESLENDPPADPSVFVDGTFEVQRYDSEKKLLIDALEYIKRLPQRFLVWYNGDSFDVPFIARRCEFHGIKDYYGIEGYPNEGSSFFKRSYTTRWEGKIVLDLYEYFANTNVETGAYLEKYENKKLNTVAKGILGKEKYDYEGNIEDLSSEELAFYNAKDTQLTFELATHDNNFPAFILFFIMRFGNLPLPKANRQGITAWWSGFQFRNLHDQGYYYPNEWNVQMDLAAMGRNRPEDLKGGDVLEPVMGLWEDISVIDFSSLYPTNIIKNNICFSTINCKHEECQPKAMGSNVIEIPEGNMWTCRRFLGFMTAAMMFFREARVTIYKPRSKKTHPEYSVFYDAISQFFKIFMNAGYGCYKNPGFAFFHILAAQCVTASSRDKLHELARLILQLGGKPIYGDSVAGPEPVIVTINEGIPLIMSLENLWDTMENTFESHDHNGTKRRLPVKGLKVWDGDDWNEVIALIKHATYKTMQRVSTGIGVVDMTNDHSLVDNEGNEFKPSEIDTGKRPVSKIFPLEDVIPLSEEDSLTQLLFALFSMSGTASYSMSIYNSQRTLAIHCHERYANKAVKILELCEPIITAFGSSYKVYKSTTKRSRTIIKFKSHVELWQAVRDNCYIGEEKLRPIRQLLGLIPYHQKLIYEYMKEYYYNPPKKSGGDRWRFGTNLEMQAFTILSELWDKKIFTYYPLPRGNTYHAKYSSKMPRMTKVAELKVAADFVYDLETENGTFMVSNIKCHNTDSVFSAKVTEKFAEILSKALGMEVENEGSWKKMLLYKKKNYILMNPDKTKIKGMTGKKKSTVPLIRAFFSKCVDTLKVGMSGDDMLDHIYIHVKEAEQKILSGQFTLPQVQLSTTLNKDICTARCKDPCTRSDHYVANVPQAQAAKKMMRHLEAQDDNSNRTFGRKGVVVEYVKTVDGWTPTVIAHEEKVDIQYLIEQLNSVFDQLVAPAGVNKVPMGKTFTTYLLKESKEQSSLERWFN